MATATKALSVSAGSRLSDSCLSWGNRSTFEDAVGTGRVMRPWSPSSFPHPQPEEMPHPAEAHEKNACSRQKPPAPGSSAYPRPKPHTLVKLASVSLLPAVRSSSRRACRMSREGPCGWGEKSLGLEAQCSSSSWGCGRKLLLLRQGGVPRKVLPKVTAPQAAGNCHRARGRAHQCSCAVRHGGHDGLRRGNTGRRANT